MGRLVYVAHPYGGKQSNRDKINKIMSELIFADPNNSYVSPIHNFGFVYLTGDEYQKGLDVCLGLLWYCSELVLCPGWEDSRGCRAEREYAQKHGKIIFTLDEWKAINRI